jgi:hypothetical protein
MRLISIFNLSFPKKSDYIEFFIDHAVFLVEPGLASLYPPPTRHRHGFPVLVCRKEDVAGGFYRW